jgi:peptidoglycan/LPS O-acetylase OafA/YrhL
MNQFQPGWTGFVSFVLSIVLPAVVALVTKESWSGTVKSFVLLGLAAVKSVAEAFVLNGRVDVTTLTAIGYTFAIGVIGYVVIKGTPLHAALVDNGVRDSNPFAAVPPVKYGSAVFAGAVAGDGLPAGFEMPLIPVATANVLAAQNDAANAPPVG